MGETLWTAVDCACGKPTGLARSRSTPLQEINLLYLGDLVDALTDSADLLAARIDDLEYRLVSENDLFSARIDATEETINRLVAFLNQPLPPAVLIERLNQLREEMKP